LKQYISIVDVENFQNPEKSMSYAFSISHVGMVGEGNGKIGACAEPET
jgi:hypothetical protein